MPVIKAWVLGVCLLATSFTLAGDETRDLSQYEVLGPYHIQGIASRPEDYQVEGRVREFLWAHWRHHKRGTVVATTQYVEGFVRASYFVEPDKRGRWLIVQYIDYPYHQAFPPKKFSCSQFERVEPDRLHLPLIPIPDLATRLPERYLLHPICSKGKNAKLW